MEQWSEFRGRVLVEGVSRRQMMRETGMHWKRLVKILSSGEPPGYQHQKAMCAISGRSGRNPRLRQVSFEGCGPASEYRVHGDPFQFGKFRLVALEDLPIPFWRKGVDAPCPPFTRVELNN